MSLIIRDRAVVRMEEMNVEDEVKKAIHEVSKQQRAAYAPTAGAPAGSGLPPLTSGQMPSLVESLANEDAEEEIIHKVSQKVQPVKKIEDGLMGKLRKLIPSEVFIAWSLIKEGFNRVIDTPGEYKSHGGLEAPLTAAWAVLLVRLLALRPATRPASMPTPPQRSVASAKDVAADRYSPRHAARAQCRGHQSQARCHAGAHLAVRLAGAQARTEA